MSALDDPDFDGVYGELEHFRDVIRSIFPAPTTPENASRFALMAQVALEPLVDLAADNASIEWFLPASVDAVQRAAAALTEALEQLESVIDEIGTIEPGTPFVPAEGPARGMLP